MLYLTLLGNANEIIGPSRTAANFVGNYDFGHGTVFPWGRKPNSGEPARLTCDV